MSFFVLLFLQPHTSTLFPYTTLFRSSQRAALLGRDHAQARLHAQRLLQMRHKQTHKARLLVVVARRPPRSPADADRKSTRLNSSHMSISYAVFCLKKKKKKKNKIISE